MRIGILDKITLYPCCTREEYYSSVNGELEGYNPSLVHHLFENECVEGFLDISLKLYYIPDTFDMYVELQGTPDEGEYYQSLIEGVFAKLQKVSYPGGFIQKKQEFLESLNISNRLNFSVPGQPEGLIKVDNMEYEVRRLRFFGEEQTREIHIHRRIEWFLHLFIDACSSIKYDNRWNIYLLYKIKTISKEVGSSKEVNKRIKVGEVKELVGFVSIYTFFSLPKYRKRISQFCIFPNHQGKGIGLTFLTYIHRVIIKDIEVMAIAVEDPAESFKIMRDTVSLLLAVENNILDVSQIAPNLRNIAKPLDRKEIRKKLETINKEPPYQVRRIIRILRLSMTLDQKLLPIDSIVEVCKDPDIEKLDHMSQSDKESLKNGNQKERLFYYVYKLRKLIAKEYVERFSNQGALYIKEQLNQFTRESIMSYYRTIVKVSSILSDSQLKH